MPGPDIGEAMRRLADAPFLLAVGGRKRAVAFAENAPMRELHAVAEVSMLAARMPNGRIQKCILTDSRRELEIALLDALRTLAYDHADECLPSISGGQHDRPADRRHRR